MLHSEHPGEGKSAIMKSFLHCSTLQHTTTLYSALQHIATTCHTTLLHSEHPGEGKGAVMKECSNCSTLQHTTTHYNTLQHSKHPEEGKSAEFPWQIAMLADCTTIFVEVSEVAYMDKSCHAHECAISHMNKSCPTWISHVPHDCVMSHKNALSSASEYVLSHIWMSRVTGTNESWHRYEWAMLHIWMSLVAHLNEMCHTYAWVVSRIRMSHVTNINESYERFEWVTSKTWMSHVTQSVESCHTYSSMVSCHTYKHVYSYLNCRNM